jgi:hypothetical protein
MQFAHMPTCTTDSVTSSDHVSGALAPAPTTLLLQLIRQLTAARFGLRSYVRRPQAASAQGLAVAIGIRI